jgi:hypothetical protein
MTILQFLLIVVTKNEQSPHHLNLSQPAKECRGLRGSSEFARQDAGTGLFGNRNKMQNLKFYS